MKFIIFLLFFVSILNGKIILEKSTYELTEDINSKKFTQSENNLNGFVTKIYKIDDQVVDCQNFQKTKLKAKKQQWIKKMELEEKQKGELLRHNSEMRLKLNKKVLSQELSNCKNRIKNIKKANLENYLVFDKETFLEQEWEKFVNFLIPELDKILDKDDSELNIQLLGNFIEKLEPYKIKLEKFLSKSISNAISKCDDTKKLKSIMKLIEE